MENCVYKPAGLRVSRHAALATTTLCVPMHDVMYDALNYGLNYALCDGIYDAMCDAMFNALI